MKKLLTLLLLAMCPAFGASYSLFSSNLTLNSQSGWTPTISTLYYGQGACNLRIFAGTNAWPGSVPFAAPAGTYRLWMLSKSYNDNSTGGNVGVVVGDATNTFTWLTANIAWHDMGIYSPTIAFTNVALMFTNNTITNLHDYQVAAMYMTTLTNEAFVNSALYADTVNYIADYSVPTVTNLTRTSGGNLLLNSSFELGLGAGWTWSRDTFATNRALWLSQGLDTNNPHTGQYCLRIGETNARYQAISPKFMLSGSNEYTGLTISIYARSALTSGAPTLSANLIPVMPAVTGLPYSNSISMTFGSPGTNWTRYTNKVYVSRSPSREYYMTFQHVSTTADLWIDSIQIEEGTNATPYMPAGAVEVGIKQRAGGSCFYAGDRVTRDLVTYNAGASNQAITVVSRVYDGRNVLITNMYTSFIAPPGVSTNVIFPPSDPGHYRVLSYVRGEPGWIADETVYSVVFFSPNTTVLSNSLFGTHTVAAPSLADTNNIWGIPWIRVFSVASIRWETVQPTSNAWNWATGDFAIGQLAGHTRMMVALGDMKGEPAWAFDGSRNVYTNSLYLYVSNLVARYKDSVKDWETDNEPWAGTPEYFTTNQVATMIATEVAAIKAADPTARVWAGGGYTIATKLSSVYALLDATTRSNIHGYTCHLYPSTTDKNLSSFDQRVFDFAALGTSWGKFIMNSESGVWDFGSRHALPGWVARGTYIFPWDFGDVYARVHDYTPALSARQAIRATAMGMIHMYYDARLSGKSWSRPDTQPYLFEFDDALSARWQTYATAANVIKDATPLGLITLTNSNGGTNLECYAYGGVDGSAIAAIWPRLFHTNFTISLTQSNFAVRDGYGKLVSTNTGSFTLGRLPTYLISSTLGTNTLISALQGGTVTPLTDSVAPALSLDVEVSGNLTTNSLPLAWKWTAADARFMTTDMFQTHVLSRYRIAGSTNDWSAWAAKSRYTLEELPQDGFMQLEVQTKDILDLATNTAISRIFYKGNSVVTNASVGTLIVP